MSVGGVALFVRDEVEEPVGNRTFEHLVEFCGRHGYRAFAETHLIPVARRLLQSASEENDDELRMLQHTMAEWFPTSEDHKKAFDEALRDKRWLGSKLEHWIESFNRRGEQPPDLTDVLRLWVSTPPTEDEFELSVTLIRHWGNRRNLSVLQGFPQALTGAGGVVLNDVSYDVKRRSLR